MEVFKKYYRELPIIVILNGVKNLKILIVKCFAVPNMTFIENPHTMTIPKTEKNTLHELH